MVDTFIAKHAGYAFSSRSFPIRCGDVQSVQMGRLHVVVEGVVDKNGKT